MNEVARLTAEYRHFDPRLPRELDEALDEVAERLRHLTGEDDWERDHPAVVTHRHV